MLICGAGAPPAIRLPKDSVIPRRLSAEEPALSEAEGISRAAPRITPPPPLPSRNRANDVERFLAGGHGLG
jgi:hypothetical protein